MRSPRGLGCLAVLLVGAGCGRLGFEPAEPVSEEPLPIHRDAGSDAQLDDAGSVLAEADAGDAPSNGKPRGPDPVDARLLLARPEVHSALPRFRASALPV